LPGLFPPDLFYAPQAPSELTPWVLCLTFQTAKDGSSPLATSEQSRGDWWGWGSPGLDLVSLSYLNALVLHLPDAPVCTGAQWMLGGAAGTGAEF
jgi:hypothetical protein